MKHSTKVMPVAAAFAAFSTIACCLPAGLTAAVGLVGLSMAILTLHNWFIGLSIFFLAVALFQLYRGKGTCQKRSWSSIVIFVIAAISVLGVSLFPQTIAVVIADLFP